MEKLVKKFQTNIYTKKTNIKLGRMIPFIIKNFLELILNYIIIIKKELKKHLNQ